MENNNALPGTMKAIVFSEPNGPLQLSEKELPELRPGELLVRIKAASICASDLIVWKGYVGDLSDLVPGHEGVGIVAAVAEPAAGFKVGDRVGFLSSLRSCTACSPCRAGDSQFCESGKKNQGFDFDGVFAEYAVASAAFSVKVPNELPLERLSPLFCAGITAFRALKNVGASGRGLLGIFGLGGVGTFAVRFAIAMGYTVVGFDVSPDARGASIQLGARLAMDPTDLDMAKTSISKLTEGEGLVGAIVCVGVVPAYVAAAELTGFARTIIAVGVPREPISFPPLALIQKGLLIKGTQIGNSQDLRDMIAFVQAHNIVPDIELGRLEDIPAFFARFAEGRAKTKLGFLLS